MEGVDNSKGRYKTKKSFIATPTSSTSAWELSVSLRPEQQTLPSKSSKAQPFNRRGGINKACT